MVRAVDPRLLQCDHRNHEYAIGMVSSIFYGATPITDLPDLSLSQTTLRLTAPFLTCEA